MDSPVIPTAVISGITNVGRLGRGKLRELPANPLGPTGGTRRVLQHTAPSVSSAIGSGG